MSEYQERLQEDVVTLLRAWPDIEEELLENEELAELRDAVKEAFRVEVAESTIEVEYVLYFDQDKRTARRAAGVVEDTYALKRVVRAMTPGVVASARVRLVSRGKPIRGARVSSSDGDPARGPRPRGDSYSRPRLRHRHAA